MTIDIEEQLAAGMRQRVAGEVLASDVLGEATRRHHRRIVAHRAAYAAGVVGLAGVLAAGVAIGGGGDPVGRANPPAAASATSARLRLAAAVAATDNTSYKVKVTAGTKAAPGSRATTQGAYDPAAATGYLTSLATAGGPSYYERLIDGVRYIGSSGSNVWKQQSGDGKLHYVDALGGAIGASADPSVLFEALRQQQATITQTGDGGYHFVLARRLDDAAWTVTVTLTGDVTLDAGNRIATVAYESRTQGVAHKKPSDAALDSTETATVRLSDYGTAVTVDKPTDVVVAH